MTRAAARTKRSILHIVCSIARKLRYLSRELVTGDFFFFANTAHEHAGTGRLGSGSRPSTAKTPRNSPPIRGMRKCEIQIKWRADSRKR
jgi:hypothetical protein